jgi:hypothetical protein
MMTADGVVLGGNSRTMSMQRVYAMHPEKAAEMRQYLADHAHEVGLHADDVAAMKNPILVREVEVEDKSKQGLQLLVRQMNESFTQGMDPRTMQVAMGRKLDEQALSTLANAMEEDETLGAFLSSSRAEPFINALMRAGVIDQRNASQYMRKGTKQLNNDGKQLVARILVGRTVGDADILSDTGTQMIGAVAQAVPAMTQATAHGKIDAFNDLQRRAEQGIIPALDPKMPEQRFKGLFNYFDDLFGDTHPVVDNERATMLFEVLIRKRGPVQLAKVFRDYAHRASQHPEGQATMFGAGLTPIEVLRETVKGALQKSMSYFVKARGPFIGPRGGKWADPQHKIPWKEGKAKKPKQMGLFDKPKRPKAKPAEKPYIVRIVEIHDTRERELIETEGGHERSVPIPGSGVMRSCDRCQKDHEVHATVEISDGTTMVMGTGCAIQFSPDVKARVKSLESASKTLGRRAHELAEMQDKLTKRKKTNSEVSRRMVEEHSDNNRWVFPAMRVSDNQKYAQPGTVWMEIGDARRLKLSWERDSEVERKLQWEWKHNRHVEYGWKETRDLEDKIAALEKQVRRLHAKREKLVNEQATKPPLKKSFRVIPLSEYARRRA